jgi:DNA invertase Pin-like site-specific DNA recombinase
VIDDDWGKSADTAAGRAGFQRLVAEVSVAHVGIILGLEISRLARSNRDWHHLLEVCALFGTLIGDQDGIDDPTDSNDRLLLGLKNPSLYNTSFTCGLAVAPSAAPASRDSG